MSEVIKLFDGRENAEAQQYVTWYLCDVDTPWLIEKLEG